MPLYVVADIQSFPNHDDAMHMAAPSVRPAAANRALACVDMAGCNSWREFVRLVTSSGESSVKNKGKIVVAEDELHILRVLSVRLREAGYEVLTATDGEQLFELAQIERPDLLISDVQMPHLSGLEACQRLRQMPGTAGIPTIMITPAGFQLCSRALHNAGVNLCLNKPFGKSELLGAVDDVLAATA